MPSGGTIVYEENVKRKSRIVYKLALFPFHHQTSVEVWAWWMSFAAEIAWHMDMLVRFLLTSPNFDPRRKGWVTPQIDVMFWKGLDLLTTVFCKQKTDRKKELRWCCTWCMTWRRAEIIAIFTVSGVKMEWIGWRDAVANKLVCQLVYLFRCLEGWGS